MASGQVDIFDRSLVRLTFGQMDPPLVRLQVRLTFLPDLQVRLTFGQITISREIVAMCITTLVRLISGQIYPLVETSCGQVCY